MGPSGCGLRCGSAQLRSPVGRLAVAATAAPIPAVLKNDLRESMGWIVLLPAKKMLWGSLPSRGPLQESSVLFVADFAMAVNPVSPCNRQPDTQTAQGDRGFTGRWRAKHSA